MIKKALIVGFFGRNNSGDEMMLEMHRRILMRLGFTQIDVSTEMSEDVVPNYRYPIQKILPREKDYSLVLIGGGALDAGFGFFPASYLKFHHGAKVILSSVNVAPHHQSYLSMLRFLCDLIVTRSVAQYQRCKNELPALRYLPDVSTIYRPVNTVVENRIAIIIRNDPKTVIRFRPKDPFDVLVLSHDDQSISQRYAREHSASLVDLSLQPPQEHLEAISRYDRVISAGRFHAALYAASLKRDFVYLFPNFPKKMPDEILNKQGDLTWSDIKALGPWHASLTKAGVFPDQLYESANASELDYIDAFANVLK